MKFRSGQIAFLAASLLLTVNGCQATTPTAATQKLRILTTTTVLADLTRNIVGDQALVESLLPPGADPHAYQAVPADAAKISQSDVIVVNGAGYEHAFQSILDDAGPRTTTVTASEGLTPETANDEANPHFWVNPQFAIRYVENISQALIQVKPENRDAYSANASAYIDQLEQLDTWATQEISAIPAERRLLVTNHDALGYFAEHYGFEVIGIIIPSASDQAGASAEQMAAVVDAVRANNVPAIFLDEVENPDLARQISDETGAEVVSDLHFETLSGPDGPATTYLDMIRYDVNRIVQALQPQ